MSTSAVSIAWVLWWMWGSQALPFVGYKALSPEQVVPLGGKKLYFRQYLASLDAALHVGRGDGRLTKAEFHTARELPRGKYLRLWETYEAFAQFARQSRRVARCIQRRRKKCGPWPQVLRPFATMRARTQDKKRRIHYPYSRYTRLCRELASLRNRGGGAQYSRAMARAKQRRKRMQRLLAWIQGLPKFKRKQQWVHYLKQKWKDPAYRKKTKKALGFLPSKRQFKTILRMIERGRKPGVGEIFQLVRLAGRLPLTSFVQPNMLAGWLIWGGDQRKRKLRWRDWRSFLKKMPRSCQAPQRAVLRRSFFCGTTLRGAEIILSKSALLSHFARTLMKPWRGVTFDESLRRCLTRRIGIWMMPGGYGDRCLPKAKKTRLMRLLARSSMQRYEPYNSARYGAILSLARWRPKKALPCLLQALHPRREKSSGIRVAVLRELGRIARTFPSKRRLIRRFVHHSADRSFERNPRVQVMALQVAVQLGDQKVLKSLLAQVLVRPEQCTLRSYVRGSLRFSGWSLPDIAWKLLADDMELQRRSKAERAAMYRMVQCNVFPIAYVRRTIRFLQPRYEPDPALRWILWQSLLWRYLAMYRSKFDCSGLAYASRAHLYMRCERRFVGRSSATALARLLLLYARDIGLDPAKEPVRQIRAFVLYIVAALQHPLGFRLLHQRTARGRPNHALWQTAIRARSAVFREVVLPRIQRLRTLRNHKPLKVYTQLSRYYISAFDGWDAQQRASAKVFFRGWLRSVKSADVRRLIQGVLQLLQER